ncbi:hypothetical protein PIB30_068398 [Stylosanthes scabra]|uniref:Uncharacterized protein n=1 Tax=Stylosanthes scabra TaxID=79078 RepID=A0ABU6WMT2_9FABA|nr:hypothetical protein [Stylosanthes scabra]
MISFGGQPPVDTSISMTVPPPTCFLKEETAHWTWAVKEADFEVHITTLAPLPRNLVSDIVDGGTTS